MDVVTSEFWMNPGGLFWLFSSVIGMFWLTPFIELVINKFGTHVRFEVLTAVIVRSSVFWDVMPCSPLNVNRSFRGTCRLHLRVQINWMWCHSFRDTTDLIFILWLVFNVCRSNAILCIFLLSVGVRTWPEWFCGNLPHCWTDKLDFLSITQTLSLHSTRQTILLHTWSLNNTYSYFMPDKAWSATITRASQSADQTLIGQPAWRSPFRCQSINIRAFDTLDQSSVSHSYACNK
jgi:hypothetical protein